MKKFAPVMLLTLFCCALFRCAGRSELPASSSSCAQRTCPAATPLRRAGSSRFRATAKARRMSSIFSASENKSARVSFPLENVQNIAVDSEGNALVQARVNEESRCYLFSADRISKILM